MMLSFQGKTSGEEAQPFWGDAVLGRRQRQAGFKSADRLEVKAIRGLITIAAKPEAAENEHTPEQRRKISAQLAEGLADLKAGRVQGPFSAAQAAKFLRAEIKSRVKTKSSK